MNTITTDKYNKLNEAIDKISSLGFKVEKVNNNTELHFNFKNKRIIYYPKKEWATGSSIIDCRGLGNLLKQIRPINESSFVSVEEIKNTLIQQISDAKQKIQTSTDLMLIRYSASIDAFKFILDFINNEQ